MKYNPYLIAALKEDIIEIGRVERQRIRVVSNGLVMFLRVPCSVAQFL